MLIDFHSHFLPGIDDGAQDIQTGCEMASQAYSQGVEYLVATPHFYPEDSMSVKEAKIQRDESYNNLISYANENNIKIPTIIKGFEVAYHKSLAKINDLSRLCIEGTNTILLELPYYDWNDKLIEGIYELSISGYDIVIAHVERYLQCAGNSFLDVVDLNVKFQLSCFTRISGETKKFFRFLIKNGRYCIMGSDMHNLETRPCNIESSYKYMKKKYKNEVEDLFYNNAYNILF